MAVNHYFTVYSTDGVTKLFTSTNKVNGETVITVTETGLTIGTETYTYSGDKKFVGVTQYINNTSPDDIKKIGSTFDGNWEYVYIVEEESAFNAVTVTYNDNVIAIIEGGQTATLSCAGKKMSTDISITAPEVEEKILQEKTITENGEVVPDEGYDGFSKVNVNVPIPDGYIQPSGTKEITENGTYDINEFATIEVNVPIPVVEMYDGIVTYSGGVNIINFTIDGTEYQAEEGMTWVNWCDSTYNTAGFYYSPNYTATYSSSGKYVQGYVNVNKNDTILNAASYTTSSKSHDGGETG